MLDIIDFIKERGGDPEKIRESQRRRYAKVEVVDEVIAMFEDARRTNYDAMQLNTKINDVQKQIGAKKKVRLQRAPTRRIDLGLFGYMANTGIFS
jgi:seryl-tRNA synthetase